MDPLHSNDIKSFSSFPSYFSYICIKNKQNKNIFVNSIIRIELHNTSSYIFNSSII